MTPQEPAVLTASSSTFFRRFPPSFPGGCENCGLGDRRAPRSRVSRFETVLEDREGQHPQLLPGGGLAGDEEEISTGVDDVCDEGQPDNAARDFRGAGPCPVGHPHVNTGWALAPKVDLFADRLQQGRREGATRNLLDATDLGRSDCSNIPVLEASPRQDLGMVLLMPVHQYFHAAAGSTEHNLSRKRPIPAGRSSTQQSPSRSIGTLTNSTSGAWTCHRI